MKKYILLLMLMATTFPVLAQIKGNYAIRNADNGMLLRVKDANGKNGTPLVCYYPENWKCMTWEFKSQGDNVYQLRNLFTSKTFMPQLTAAAGVSMEEQPLVIGNAEQQYEFEKAGEKTYRIKLKGTSLYLTPANKSKDANVPVILAAKTDDKNQQWTIYEQSPTM